MRPSPLLSSETERRVRCELLGSTVHLPERPQRVVSFVSGLTEAAFEMGLGERIAGVSKYCRRYVPIGSRQVAGDYLRIDGAVLDELQPDLVIMTGGVQGGVAKKLSADGWPVYVLPLPDSFAGVVENIRRLGALLGEMPAALALTDRMERTAADLRAIRPVRPPRVYAELCFGRHKRMAGGLTFVHDIIELAGGENLWREKPTGYLPLDFDAVVAAKPEVVVVFSEEDDHPVDAVAELRARGWTGQWPFKLIEASTTRGKNLIHDGPSLLETARWLRGRMG